MSTYRKLPKKHTFYVKYHRVFCFINDLCLDLLTPATKKNIRKFTIKHEVLQKADVHSKHDSSGSNLTPSPIVFTRSYK